MLDTIIQKAIRELPTNIRNAVESFDWSTEILHIANDNHIQIDDIETFRNETLLVIVGLTDAADFEKNLVSHMNISHELAEVLVADANLHIFRPLQKIAFTHHEESSETKAQDFNENLEDEIIPHEKITHLMDKHGIQLVDEFEPEPKPQNDLQDMVDDIFENKIKHENTKESEIPKNLNQKVAYNEPIHESDLRGITGHRTDTSILKQVEAHTALNKPHLVINQTSNKAFDEIKQSLDKKSFNTLHISKNESFDVSPSKEEQIVADGEFLKHIGAV